jgi:hypothetical protein
MSRALRLARRGRRKAESLMQDSCVIERPGDAQTVDGVVTVPMTAVYTGKCKLQSQRPWPSNPDAGEHSWTLVPLELHLPVSASGVQPDDRVTITASVDGLNVGRKLRVRAGDRKTFQTALRYLVEEVVG